MWPVLYNTHMPTNQQVGHDIICRICVCLSRLNGLACIQDAMGIIKLRDQPHKPTSWQVCFCTSLFSPDPIMTVENVTQVFNKIEGDKWRVMDALEIPRPVLDEIQRRSSTDADQIHACADYYVNYHPNTSWRPLTSCLLTSAELAAARESKSFMSTGKYCHYITYWYNCCAH